MSIINFPNDTQHLSIVGRNGTGKTQAACWHLSKRSWDEMPWIIIDYKRDRLIGEIEPEELEITTRVPKQAGLYVVRPMPDDDDDEVNALLRRIWAHNNCGVYLDEGYMVPDKAPLRGLLTQGRSKHIPMIILSQRPVMLSRFVFSEASFFQVFDLNHKLDRRKVTEFVPIPTNYRLRKHFSYFYDVGNHQLTEFSPVPDADAILQTFRDRRPKRRKAL